MKGMFGIRFLLGSVLLLGLTVWRIVATTTNHNLREDDAGRPLKAGDPSRVATGRRLQTPNIRQPGIQQQHSQMGAPEGNPNYRQNIRKHHLHLGAPPGEEMVPTNRAQLVNRRNRPFHQHPAADSSPNREIVVKKPPLMVTLPSSAAASSTSSDLFAICPQLLSYERLRRARLFDIRINPPYQLVLYPPGEVVSDFTVKDGSWDLELISALAPHVSFYPGEIVVNAGGNIGTLAIYYAMAGFEVFTMEPHPVNFMLLNCSAHLNHLTVGKQIHVYNQAIGAKPGQLCFSNVRERNMGAMGPNLKSDNNCQFYAPTISLSAFITERSQRFQHRFLLLLLDLEAFEPVVLQDLQTIFADRSLRPKLVVLETGCARWIDANPGIKSCQEVMDLLLRHQYSPIWPLPAANNLTDYMLQNKRPRSRDDNIIFAIKEI